MGIAPRGYTEIGLLEHCKALAYGGLTSVVDMTTGDEDTLGFVTDGGEDKLMQEGGGTITIGVKLKSKPLAEVGPIRTCSL
jgi:hypothetical protein